MTTERKHAILSASGAYRWLACPPSARLEEQFEETTSTYAEEGTLAHALAELVLRYSLNQIDTKTYDEQTQELMKSEFYSTSMLDYIETYTSIVTEKINDAWARSADAVVLLEQRLDFSDWVPEGFGTGDVVIISDGVLEIIDLKYGKGVPVSAEDNAQMRLYALGALATFDSLYDIKTVRMTIVQPRLDSVSSDEIPAEMLYWWADTELAHRAQLAWDGQGEFQAGEHCRFCRARYTCRARAEANLELAKMEFKKPELLTDEEIGEVLKQADELKAWVSDVFDYALVQARDHGKKFKGWKLVEGRSVRKYADEEAVAKTLLEAGYKEEQIYEKKLWGITAMEKLLGKTKFGELLKGLVVKPAGKPTLVPETDKRPEINSITAAVADFKNN
jgi:hypothetical protein